MKKTTLLILFAITSCMLYADGQVTLIKKHVVQKGGMSNPAPFLTASIKDGFLYFEAYGYNGYLEVTLTDTFGHQIYQQTEYCEGKHSLTIDTRNYSEGEYVLNIILDNDILYYGTFSI